MKNTLLITALLACLMPYMNAFADDQTTYETCTNCESCGEGCKYEYVGNTMNIYGPTTEGSSGSIGNAVFEMVYYDDGEGYLDTTIPSNIKNLNISGNITSIGDSAFQMASLENVVISAPITSLGASFGPHLKSIELPDTVTTIEDHAFCDISGLSYIKLPDSVTNIGIYAFSNLLDEATVILPSSLQSITTSALGCEWDDVENCSKVHFIMGENTQIINKGQNTGAITIYCTGNLATCQQNAGSLSDQVVQATVTTENGVTTIKAGDTVLASYPAKDTSIRETQPDGSVKITSADGKVHYEGKRIYTIKEANEVSAPTGNRVSLRYK